MGLSIAHGIVTSYGGTITVSSTPGIGTLVEVYLPRLAERDQVPLGQTPACPADSVGPGQGRLLLVDDEDAIVNSLQALLETYGYEVITQTSSAEVLAAFRAAPHSYDLVITDQTMPEMTGEQLARELRELRPDIPIIFCTGFSPVMDETKATEIGIDAFLMKPVEAPQLVATIEHVMARRTRFRRTRLKKT